MLDWNGCICKSVTSNFDLSKLKGRMKFVDKEYVSSWGKPPADQNDLRVPHHLPP